MSISEAKYIEKLRNSGLRPTKQRIKICEILFNREKTFHFSINELTKILLNDHNQKISIATVYNTVHALKSAGHLKEFSLENHTSYYDKNITSHHHFFDNGKVIDINSDKITFHKLPEAPKGKKIKNVEVVIRLENNN